MSCYVKIPNTCRQSCDHPHKLPQEVENKTPACVLRENIHKQEIYFLFLCYVWLSFVRLLSSSSGKPELSCSFKIIFLHNASALGGKKCQSSWSWLNVSSISAQYANELNHSKDDKKGSCAEEVWFLRQQTAGSGCNKSKCSCLWL